MRARTRPPETSMEMFVVRIGHAEREATIDLLTEHHVQGRLDVMELDRRQGAAMEATTQAELTALVADLPTGAGSATTRSPRPRWVRGSIPPTARWLVPPVAVGGTAWWMAVLHSSGGESFATGLVCGGLGIAGTWWAARRPEGRSRR